jgi:ketosteroid isomerase-like protein
MRLLTPLIAVTALALNTSAFAQEEEATATPMEEQPATTIEETPAPAPAIETTPMATERPAPPAAMSPTPKAEKSAAASPAAKAASSAPTPATTGKKMSVQAALKDNENRWAAAAIKHDVASVEPMVADDFIGVNSKGKIQSRRAMLSEMKGDKDTYSSTKNEKLDVHTYGKDVAVVVGTYREKGTGKDGKAFDRKYRFTDTWVQRNGQWKCVAGQSMLLGAKQ